MTPLPVPTTVGNLRWPVLSAVHIGTGDRPAELIAVIDRHSSSTAASADRCTTGQMLVWPDRVLAHNGHYQLTYDQVQRGFSSHQTTAAMEVDRLASAIADAATGDQR